MTWICKHCQTENRDVSVFCNKCGRHPQAIDADDTNATEEQTEERKGERRYPALKMIASVGPIIAWVNAILTVLLVFFFISSYPGPLAGALTIAVLIGGGATALFWFALPAIIGIFIHIEENTRPAAHNTRNLGDGSSR